MTEKQPTHGSRDEVLSLFRDALKPRRVRWTDELSSLGDFEGRDLALEVFDIPLSEQRATFRKLRELRRRSEELLGAPVLVVFHTPDATGAHYAALVGTPSRVAHAVFTAPLSLRVVFGNLDDPFEARIEGEPRLAFEQAA